MASVQNTTAQGDAFRDAILQLIELNPGSANVRREYKVGSQRVDIYYEEQTSIGTLRIACECKGHAKPLTREYIAREIYPRYMPLLQRRLVDAVRIIAPHEIGVDAQEYLRDICFTFSTPARLEAAIIDFRVYLQSLKSLHTLNGLDQYYIRPVLEDGQDLETVVTDWLHADSDQPLAIIAGYGMGKTSFASRIAFQCAQSVLSGEPTRIPIVIPLAEIASEQGLEGLLGKLLAAHNLVRNYHFGLFMELNRRGRFLILLDGFDEMKHTMSWAEFKHNFRELSRLVVPNARVILLGRPSAFLSDAEQLFVLRGLRKQGQHVHRVSGAAEFRELLLQMFTNEQAFTFIEHYARYLSANETSLRGAAPDATRLAERLESIRNDVELRVLVQRPVQAKMVADLAIDPGFQWRSFRRHELYSEFLHRILDRELEKPSRHRFSARERHIFQRRLAWWLWQRSAGTGFQLDTVPETLFSDLVTKGDVGDSEGIRRDLLLGSVLERKSGDHFFFPHRSFIEFLVAEHMCENHWDATTLADVDRALDPEIIGFIEESEDVASVAEWAEIMNRMEAPISFAMLHLIGWAQSVTKGYEESRVDEWATPRDVLVGYVREELRTKHDHIFVANYLRRSFHFTHDVQTRLMCLYALYLVAVAAPSDVRKRLSHLLIALILFESIGAIIEQLGQFARDEGHLDDSDPLMRILIATIARATDRTEITLEFDINAVGHAICDSILMKWQVIKAEPVECERQQVSLVELESWEPKLALTESGNYVASFFQRFPNPARSVTIQRKGAPEI